MTIRISFFVMIQNTKRTQLKTYFYNYRSNSEYNYMGKKDYRGIDIVEVIWKVVVAILNRRLTASIIFHDFLHGFREGRGTGTAALEAKLLQQCIGF